MPIAGRSHESPPARARRRAKGTHRQAHRGPLPPLLADYANYSQTALASLLFILPLLILHEIGIWHWGLAPGRLVEQRIAAYALMCQFFDWFGASARYLPALAVVAVLLSEHVVRGDRWALNIPAIGLMGVEAALLAIPLAGVYWIVRPSVGFHCPGPEWKFLGAIYLGAGVYEELLFRLFGFAVLSFLLIDCGKLPRNWGTPLVVVLAAVAFAAYHRLGIAQLPWQSFVFIALRGVYYGTIFLHRGFGVCVGVHATYDILSGLFLWENRQ